jgi:anti-sigma regulatory factor (Ser/Thr protein kinase)
LQTSVAISVTDSSQVGEARRAAAALAGRLGFDETRGGQVAIVATEAAANLVKHARDGVLLLRALEEGGCAGVEVLALDRGPGMADLARCLRDGYSTAGSPGTGLGSIARLSAFMDVYSNPAGTALLARLWSGAPPARPATPGLEHAAVSLPRPGEVVCGDAWAVRRSGAQSLCLVADGLGHGPFAADAANEAVRVLHDNLGLGPAEILRTIHLALRATRGAAVALAAVDVEQEEVRFAGVGNISASVLAGTSSQSLMSHNGTVGHEARRFQELTYPFPPGALLVMHSDGLTARWSLSAYPGLAGRDPALVAGVLCRDFQRGRDDVTVLAARAPGGTDL